jgi:glycosidase
MPKWQTDHPRVREALYGAAKKWLELGIDGFRLDHAHGVLVCVCVPRQ